MKKTVERSFPLVADWFGKLSFGFAVQGSVIFIPLLGAQLGASDFQIGMIGAVYGGSYLVSSLISGGNQINWDGSSLCAGGFCSAVLPLQLNSWPTVSWCFVVRGAVGFSLGIASAAFIAYAFEAGADMGKYSSYGSLGWIFGALGAALVGDIHLCSG